MTIHKAKLKTAAGTFDFQPQHFHADAATQGFTKKASDHSFFIFDSFKRFDGQRYVALNNFSGKQNALALVHDDLGTFEVLGHFNEPQSGQRRIEWPAPPPEEAAVMKRGVKLLTDRDYVIDEMPEAVRGMAFLRTSIEKLVLLVSQNAELKQVNPELPVVLVNPGAAFQDEARPGTIVIGMDRTKKGRIWGCWTGTGDKADGYFLLYNGIELPLPWPPPFRDPSSLEPMPVPYLTQVPRTIPIDVGRQLFVDDFFIEKTTLNRTFHQAQKFEGNPVFQADTERELGPSTQGERGAEATTFLGQGGVFYDPAGKHFKMFYTAGWRRPLSLATSTDMKTWTRHGPLLSEGLCWTGPKLTTGGSDNCVWLDLNAEKDGRTFSDAVPTSIAADDYCSFFFNPFREKWCFSIKKGTVRGRSRYYFESDQFLQGADWGKAVYWTNADRLDAPEPQGRYPGAGDAPQLYSLNAVAYESLMIGMHYIHRGPRNDVCHKGKFPKLIDLELGFSRDGFHWDRPDRRAFIVGSRTEGSWDRAYLHSTAGVFVVLDDQLVFPYMGTSGIAPSGHRGMYTGGSIGLATLRRDGLASMDGFGELTTRPVQFQGSHLFANLNGQLRMEVLDTTGQVLAVSETVSGDKTKQRVELPGLAALAGKPVKFRFQLTKGSLYAFWVTSDENGASHGYVGAGGPAFGGVRDIATSE